MGLFLLFLALSIMFITRWKHTKKLLMSEKYTPSNFSIDNEIMPNAAHHSLDGRLKIII